MVESNLMQARRGAVPGTYPLVTSYLRLNSVFEPLYKESELVDGLPVWALVYNCIRCGDLAAALHCVKKRYIFALCVLIVLVFNHDKIQFVLNFHVKEGM